MSKGNTMEKINVIKEGNTFTPMYFVCGNGRYGLAFRSLRAAYNDIVDTTGYFGAIDLKNLNNGKWHKIK